MGRVLPVGEWQVHHGSVGGSAGGVAPERLRAETDPGRGAAADTLESEENNVLGGDQGRGSSWGDAARAGASELVLVPERCGCRLCRECGSMLGRKLRGRLHEKAALFKSPRMLSLTVDLKGTITGKGFASGEEAHRYVTAGRFIAKLMSKLGIRVWVWVLEFQRNGNPHWHVLFDASELVGGRFDYDAAWRWWRDRWQVGGWKASGKADEFKSPEHALNYITKYVVKEPESGYPDWVWDVERRAVRFVGASKAVGRLVRAEDPADVDQGEEVEQEDQGEESESERKVLTYRQRVGLCHRSVKALRHRLSADGVESWEFVGGLGVRWEGLVLMIAAGVVPSLELAQLPSESGASRVVVRGRSWVHVSDVERSIKAARLMGGGELLERAECRGFHFEPDGSWTWRPVEAVA